MMDEEKTAHDTDDSHDHDHSEATQPEGSSRRDFFKTAAAGAVAATAATQLLSDQAIGHGSRDSELNLFDRSKRDRKRRVLIKGGIVLSMDPAVGDFMKADVLIEGTTIKAVGPNLKVSNAITVDASNTIVMPGFVNTHHHQAQTLLRNYFSDAHYFTSGLYPDYRRAGARGGFFEKYTPEDCYLSELVGAITNINHGVTTVVDTSQVSITPQHTDACIEGIKESGQRSVFAYYNGPGSSVDGPNYAYPNDIHRIKSKYYSSNDQLLTLALHAGINVERFQLARDIGVPIYAHATGRTLGALVETIGIGADCTLIHCQDFGESTWQKIADSGAKVSISPVAEPTCGNGTPPFLEVARHGLLSRLSFSTDAESFITADFFSQTRGAFTVQRLLTLQNSNNGQLATPVPITCREVLEIATMGGAVGANLAHKVGSLTPGKEADIIMLRTNEFNVWPITNAPGAIVTLMDTSNVDTVFIAGKPMKWRGKLVDVNKDKLLRQVEIQRNKVFERVGWNIEPFGTCCPR